MVCKNDRKEIAERKCLSIIKCEIGVLVTDITNEFAHNPNGNAMAIVQHTARKKKKELVHEG